MVNCIGKVDYPNMKIFLESVASLVGNTKHFHLLSQSGTDLEFDNATYPISCDLGSVSYTHLDVYKRQLLCNG